MDMSGGAIGDGLGSALYALGSLAVRHAPRDISLTSASTLGTLERLGPQRLTRLAERQGVAQPSMTALVGRLEHDGLVERRADPGDGRAVLVALSAAGQAAVQRRRAKGAAALAALADRLPAEQQRRLHDAVAAIRCLCAIDQLDVDTVGSQPAGRPR